MRTVNLIPIDEPAEAEVALIPVDEGAGNSSPSIVQRDAFIRSQAENPDQYIRQLSQHQVPTGYQTPDRAVAGITPPQDQQAADTFKREYVEKPASNVLARAVRAIKLYAFPVAKAMDSVNGNDDHQTRLTRDIEELSGFIDQQQPGPEVGEVGKFVRGVEELAPQVAIGGLGVANLLSSATADKGIDAVHQGINPGTATVLAEKELLQNAAFMRAPQVGKTLPQSLAIGATVNPTLGTLGRAADQLILEKAGYQQQADAVKVIDPQTMAHEAAMGVLFSVDGHARNSLNKARQPAEQARENALPTEGQAVELLPVDAAEPAAAARPEAGLDPESAAALKWAAARLSDPTASKFERQSLKQMIAEPGRQELLRTYRRNQPHTEVVEEQQQKQPALPEAGREVELIPFDEQPAIENKAPEPVFDIQTAPEQGTETKIQPQGQPTEQNHHIQQQPEVPNGTVEQIPAGKRGNADIYDLVLNPSHTRSLEDIRQAIAGGEAGGRVVIEQQGQGSTGQTVGYRSSFPEWFRNKGYSKTETLQAIDYAMTGQGVTARQKIMLEDLLQAKRSQDTNQILQQRSQPAEALAYRLNEGDTLKRNGGLFKVTDVSPDGVTIKDGETIHLNHEQTINYDRGSLKDAAGKLIRKTPDHPSSEDNPFLDMPPAEGFSDAQDALSAELTAAHARGELTPELVRQKMQELAADRVTGYQGATFHRPSLDRAWADHQATGRDFSYADIDLANLGGLNAHRGSNETANADFREISRIVQEEVKKDVPDARFFRQGGDEMSVIAPDTPREVLEASLVRADRQVQRYAAEQGIDQVPHPKHKPEAPHAPGVGIHFGTADFLGKNSVHDIITTADRATAAMKEQKGAEYVKRSQGAEAGNQPLAAQREAGSIAASDSRRSSQGTGGQAGQIPEVNPLQYQPITQPGPGGQTTASRREAGSEITQLRTSLDGMVKPKMPLSERINIGKQISEKMANAKDAAGKALSSIKGVGEAVWSAYRNPPEWSDFKKALGTYSADRQQTAMEAARFAREINKSLTPEAQEGVTNWIEAGGDRDLLEQRRDATSNAKLKKGYQAALDLTDDQARLAENIRNYYESRLDQAVEAGVLDHGVANYVNHVWERTNPYTGKVIAEVNAGLLKTNPALAKQRMWQTFHEGEQAGGVPKDKRIGYLLTAYDQSLNEAIAARAFVKSLQFAAAKDSRPLVVVSGSGSPVKEGDKVTSYVINPDARPADTGDYRHINHPALKKWKWAGKDSEGKAIMLQGDMLVHPEIYRHLSNVLGRSAIREFSVAGIKPGKLLLDGMQELKNTLLSLSAFHQVQEAVHAVGHEVNPFAAPEINLEEPLQRSLVEHGLMVFNHNALQEFGEGSVASGFMNRLPVIGEVHRKYGEYLFTEYIPRLKMKMATDAYGRNRARYKDLTDDQVKEITAKQANAAFGELNYQMLGRNKTMQDLFRLAALAPDFLEARTKFVAQALKPYGREQGAALLRLSAIMAITAQVTNLLLNNETDWSHPFSLKIGGKYYTLRSIPGDLIHLFTDPRSFAYGRVNPTLARPVIEALTGRDGFGRKRDMMTQVIDWGKGHAPIPIQGPLWKADQNGSDALLQSLGISAVVARTPAEKKARQLIMDSIPLGQRSDEEMERIRREGEILKALREKSPEASRLLQQARKDRFLTPDEERHLRKQANTPPLVNSIKHLDWLKALEVWQKANQDEKATLKPAMIDKGVRYLQLRPERQEQTRKELKEIRTGIE